VVVVSGLSVGLLAAFNPVSSASQLHSTFTIPVGVGPNNYMTERLMMTKGEIINFAAVLDNDSAIRLYIMNGSQFSTFFKCAPKCHQPLLGGQGTYYQQAGLSKPDLFLNTSLSLAKSYAGNFTSPTSGPIYFVFDNSLGESNIDYVAQNATGFAVGSIRMTVFGIATSYAINWDLVAIGVGEILVGGIAATMLSQLNVKRRLRSEIFFLKRFGTAVVLLAIIITMIIDLPVFYAAATNSPNSLLPGSGAKQVGINTTEPASSNYSVFEIDSDYLSKAGSAGYGQMSVDTADQLTFVPAPQNNSIYAYDLPNEAESDIGGFSYPVTSLYVPQGDLFVSNAGNGTVDELGVNSSGYPISFQKIAEFNFSQPDYLAYDNSSATVYVGYGSGNNSGLGLISATSNSIVGTIRLPATPAQIAVEQNGTRIFVSMQNSIAVVDKTTRSVIDSFSVGGAIALDESDGQLFVGTSSPPQVDVVDDQSGNIISTITLPSAPGAVSFDPTSKLIFASCTGGTLQVIQQDQNSTRSYFLLSSQSTGPQATASVYYPGQELVLVAVPQYPFNLAQLLTFGIYSD